jgi:hypothetical protein
MHQVQLNERIYREAERRARDAGFESVDQFVATCLETEFSDSDNFDDRFTPEVIAHLDQLSAQMHAGRSVSAQEVDQHLSDVRATWLKKHAT